MRDDSERPTSCHLYLVMHNLNINTRLNFPFNPSSHSVFIRRLGMKHYIQRHSVCLFTIRIQSWLLTVLSPEPWRRSCFSPLGLLASQSHNVPHVLSDPAYNNRSTSSRRCCLTYSTLRRVENKMRSNKRGDFFPAPRQLMMSASGAITRLLRTFNHLW